MKPTRRTNMATVATRMFALALAMGLLMALSACNVRSAGTATNENAAENRQYMAMLNQKTEDLSEVLEQFQVAVSASDTVGMQAAASKATKILDSIKQSDPPKSDGKDSDLSEVKKLYVEGLESMNAVLQQYSDLYNAAAAGTLTQASFTAELETVQASYDQAVEKLTNADKTLTDLANE